MGLSNTELAYHRAKFLGAPASVPYGGNIGAPKREIIEEPDTVPAETPTEEPVKEPVPV